MYIILTFIIDIDLDYLAEVVFVRFLLTVVTLFSSFSYCTFSKEITIYSPHLRSGDLCSSSWKGQNIYINYFEFFRTEDLAPSPFIYLLIVLSLWTDIYFILWIIIQYCYLFCC